MTIPPLNLSLNQTPVSGLTDQSEMATGSFFSNSAPPMSGSHDLIGGVSAQANGVSALAIAGGLALLSLLLLRR
tara:strand:+ start:9437 stop:9658 length:222 start_codon:yes stop_codon:yes gene_type:complete